MDNFRISDLCVRYGLSTRQAVYDRIKALGINQAERGKISATDLELMDALDKHLKSGGLLDNFAKVPEVVHPDKISLSTGQLDKLESTEEYYAFNKLLELFEKLVFAQQQAPSFLDKLGELEKVSVMGWILPSSEIARLIGFKPRILGCKYGCFKIERCGKVGRQAGWIVKKVTWISE